MALTVTTLAGAMRLGDGTTAPVEPTLFILTRLLSAAGEIIDKHVDPDDVPEDVRDEAIIRLAAYSYDSPFYARSPMNAYRNSGASSLIAPYTTHRAGIQADSEST